MKKKIIKIITLCLSFVMLFAIAGFTDCVFGGASYERLTNEEHIERITTRVQERFFSEDSDYPYTDFTVTILYHVAGFPGYFMVQFEPEGFLYGTIYRNEYYVYFDWNFHPKGRNPFYEAGIIDERKYISMAAWGTLNPRIRLGEYFVCICCQDRRTPVSAIIPEYRARRHHGRNRGLGSVRL